MCCHCPRPLVALWLPGILCSPHTTPQLWLRKRTHVRSMRFLKMLIFLEKEDHLDACCGCRSWEGAWPCLDCVTWDKLNTQQWARELPGCHRGAGRSESLASSHMNVCWLWNSCWKSKWQLEFPLFTALVSVLQSWREKAKQEKSTQDTSLITLRK